MIDERPKAPATRISRVEQRTATRLAILEATVTCLVDEGYAALTTRRVAELAGVAQSTLMHHFESRDSLLIEAVSNLAGRLAGHALTQIDLAAARKPELRESVLDQTWQEFTSPEALAAAQLWSAAWAEPELAATLRELEQRLTAIIAGTARTLFPGEADDPTFPALIDIAVSLIRGLLMAIPISGREAVDERWLAIKPVLLQSAADLLDRAGSKP